VSRVEELVALRASVAAARRALLEPARAREWMAPDVSFRPRGAGAVLAPGDQFRIELVGGWGFEYVVEGVSDREVVLSFKGPWDGTERWSFVADGAETLVRRVYEVERGAPLAMVAWETVGRPIVAAHLRLELARLRSLVERDPGPAAEIAPSAVRRVPPSGEPESPPEPTAPLPFPVDDG